MRSNLMYCALALAVTLGCSQKTGFETVAPGSAVTVTETDGTTVRGQLVEVSADEVVVDQPREGRRVMRRDAVTSIAVTEESPEETLAGRAEGAASESEPVVALARWTEVVLPSGSTMDVTLDTPVGSDVSRVEGAVSARIVTDVQMDGRTVIPAGAALSGSVLNVVRPAKVKGLGSVAFRFDRLATGDETYDIQTATVSRRARATKKDDALKIGIPAAGGAVIGGIVGGKKGAAIGTAVGGGAGTAVVLSTRGEDVHLPEGTAVTVQLTEPLRVRVRL